MALLLPATHNIDSADPTYQGLDAEHLAEAETLLGDEVTAAAKVEGREWARAELTEGHLTWPQFLSRVDQALREGLMKAKTADVSRETTHEAS